MQDLDIKTSEFSWRFVWRVEPYDAKLERHAINLITILLIDILTLIKGINCDAGESVQGLCFESDMVVVLCCVSVREFPKPHKAHKAHRHCSLAHPRHLSKSWQFWWTWGHGWLCAHHMWWYFTPDAGGVCIYDDRNTAQENNLGMIWCKR